LISKFFDENIKNKFFEENCIILNLLLTIYWNKYIIVILDIYIDESHNNKIWIIDFGPWSDITNPILFEWDELNKINNINTNFKIDDL